jgi:hypothetical protein
LIGFLNLKEIGKRRFALSNQMKLKKEEADLLALLIFPTAACCDR